MYQKFTDEADSDQKQHNLSQSKRVNHQFFMNPGQIQSQHQNSKMEPQGRVTSLHNIQQNYENTQSYKNEMHIQSHQNAVHQPTIELQEHNNNEVDNQAHNRSQSIIEKQNKQEYSNIHIKQNDHSAHSQKAHSHNQHDESHIGYKPLQIPADWNIAKEHALARSVGPEKEISNPTHCPCCGWQIEREEVSYSDDVSSLNFLGSGFPCFYNFIIYCLFMLILLFCISGIFNIVTNYLGNFCATPEEDMHGKTQGSGRKLGEEEEEAKCHYNWAHIFSMANKKDRPEFISIQAYLNLLVSFAIMIALMLFRRSQRQIDIEIDASQATPSDYTMMVRNIPKMRKEDYVKCLIKIFQSSLTNDEIEEDKPLLVKKVNLVYDIEEIIYLEEQINKYIEKKQDYLTQKQGKVSHNDKFLEDIEEEIEHIEHRIEELEENIPNDPGKFTGIAFISFQYENHKQQILQKYQELGCWDQLNNYCTRLGESNNREINLAETITQTGALQQVNSPRNPAQSEKEASQQSRKNSIEEKQDQIAQITQGGLYWGKYKLELSEAPEPNDVDWEFIHVDESDQNKGFYLSSLLSLLFMTGCFFMIWFISKYQSSKIEEAFELAEKGKMPPNALNNIKIISVVISWIIVFFNKFVLGIVYHHIVDLEKIPTKTQFNVSYAKKLSVALFLNSAMITYIVEILGSHNYYGPGGFIYTETMVFVWNCFIPPLVWLVDPWTIIQNFKRNTELEKAKRNISFVTQKQANELMEKPNYLSGKRYADLMKTMWFTFFYAPCIPLGNFFSMLNLILYYYIDKYNVMRRRTIKESLSKDVSISMIEMLEFIIIFFAIGNFTFSLHLFQYVEWQSYIQLLFGLMYALLPMNQVNEYLFPLDTFDELLTYEEAQTYFKTDYDRENPITKNKAMKLWQKQNNAILNNNLKIPIQELRMNKSKKNSEFQGQPMSNKIIESKIQSYN